MSSEQEDFDPELELLEQALDAQREEYRYQIQEADPKDLEIIRQGEAEEYSRKTKVKIDEVIEYNSWGELYSIFVIYDVLDNEAITVLEPEFEVDKDVVVEHPWSPGTWHIPTHEDAVQYCEKWGYELLPSDSVATPREISHKLEKPAPDAPNNQSKTL